ncbi:MAG TPA: hypothetical protein VL793_03230, partial [Patescibacteria group bacterium]|nr:hypothetical protein [Patescibacteria group bacterium]
GQIRWRNYYDYGDPIGFKLDSARLWLKKVGCTAFEFCGCEKCRHDIGFARYMMPGEAHNEYWNDPAVFKHFILDVVKNKNGSDKGPQAAVPKNKWHVAFFSPVLPYVFSIVLVALGVFILFKAVYSFTHPNLDPLQKFVRFSQLGAQVSGELSALTIFRAVVGITALIAGAIILARVPHLAMTWPWTRTRRVIRRFLDKEKVRNRIKWMIDPFGQNGRACRQAVRNSPVRMWTVVGLAGFAVGFALYAIVTPQEVRDDIGSQFAFLQPLCPKGWAPTLGVVLVAGLVAALSELLVVKRRGPTNTPKRSNWRRSWIFKGLHPFIVLGALAVFAITIIQLKPASIQTLGLTSEELNSLKPLEIKMLEGARFSSNELVQVKEARGTNWLATIKRVEPVLAVDPPVWPVILAGAAFLYLWWLATLVFDLAFVWHRYIRHSITNDRLREWNPYGFARRCETGKEECCNVLKE